MSKAKTSSKTRQTYKFTESHCDEFNVTLMCRGQVRAIPMIFNAQLCDSAIRRQLAPQVGAVI
ncbi:hypothetical protein PSP20601_05234 [Pandoraea sputorum]|uniref:Uncharacterized protein n=1 Tax=Pandoraea sputorum TaxID=93222 RepID=A0A239SFJ6_9BURK|nr:hypothetical protein NA29_11700 [Pandoraea sputorum]SNU83443.1 Uncharacterised protein [Pandoraea sputorum]VVE57938.1 hypothetical protein PSP20601_05234 [Pandoraea sputorum]